MQSMLQRRNSVGTLLHALLDGVSTAFAIPFIASTTSPRYLARGGQHLIELSGAVMLCFVARREGKETRWGQTHSFSTKLSKGRDTAEHTACLHVALCKLRREKEPNPTLLSLFFFNQLCCLLSSKEFACAHTHTHTGFTQIRSGSARRTQLRE